jgi:dinuclear metal center YbgI/SA1388 family protein
MKTGAVELKDLVAYLDEFLQVAAISDSQNAWNGMQVEREGPIQRVAFAVDAAQVTIDEAHVRGAELLIVHHGLFWDGVPLLTGRRYTRLRTLLERNIALYSSHLPLDVHKLVGNNCVLARELGMEVDGWFGEFKGVPLGVHGRLEIRREALAARLDYLLGGRVRLIPGGPERVSRVGVITGGAGNYVQAAREAGLDAFITGEGAHHNYFDAMEGGINLYFGGHYATEVWGLRALASHLSDRFELECFFIDHPTKL